MTGPIIETPRGQIFHTAGGGSRLVWNTNFRPKWQRRYSRAQMFVDSEVLRWSEPFTPLLTGTLIKTGILGTEIGSGLVQWIAPYARKRYYTPGAIGSQTGPLRGFMWFERAKRVHGAQTVAAARRMAGGG